MNEPEKLSHLIKGETSLEVSNRVKILADAISHRGEATAILFYGSGLWKEEADDTLYDFYVLCDRYRSFGAGLFLSALGYALPPNVYYIEIPYQGGILRCKYALMRADQFLQAAKGRALTPQIWARFAQPCRIVYAKDETARRFVNDALVQAVLTFHKHTLKNISGFSSPEDLWRQGLGLTYGAELRSEKPERTKEIVGMNSAAFSERTRLALASLPSDANGKFIKSNKKPKKLIAFLRLLKATLTFHGAVDYGLWKVERQSGLKFRAGPLERRYPLIFGWRLAWKIYKAGGFR